MTKKNNDFDSKLEMGQTAEAKIEELLVGVGFTILRSSWRLKKQETSPRLEWHGKMYDLPEPDLLVELDGVRRWVEVKCKRKWVTSMGPEEIGFDQNKMDPYEQIQRNTDIPMVVFFVVGDSIESTHLDFFADKKRPWDGYDRAGRYVKEPDYLVKREHLDKWE